MPRGDKRQMLTYQAASSPRQDTIASTTILTEQIAINDRENDKLTALRDVILPKLMSGEIDVSKIDFTQLNSHLVQRDSVRSKPVDDVFWISLSLYEQAPISVASHAVSYTYPNKCS